MNLVAGIHPVETLLREAASRIESLYILDRKKPSRRIAALLGEAAKHRIPVVRVSPGEVPSFEVPHQGIWAKVTDFAYTPFQAWLEEMRDRDSVTMLILDGITDPHNLGAILRSAACLGCQGVLIPKDRSAVVTPAAWKASAGAAAILPVLRETNLSRCVRRLKKEGFWIFGTRAGEGIPLYEAPWSEKSAVILGSEEKGIRPLLASQCDMHLVIPITGPVASLNVSVAAGIVLYARLQDRQTRLKRRETA